MKKLKYLTLALAAAIGISFAGCGNTSGTPSASTPEGGESGDSSSTTTIKVGASPAPHSEILEQVKPILAQQGITLEIFEFTDYVIPNNALEDGSIDANFFQHGPYLDTFNEKNGTTLVSAAPIHFEPLGIYPGKTASLDALPEGAQIAIPNDTSNGARALLLLEEYGLIKLKEGVGLNATVLDITEYTKDIKITELEAALIVNMVGDFDLAVINGNYAIGGGIADTVLAAEDKESEAAQKYANIIAVRPGDESRPEIQQLIAALQSDEVKAFIEQKYEGSVLPAF